VVCVYDQESHALLDARRHKGFGGDENDAAHIGGWLKNDTNSWVPAFWDYLIDVQRVSSLIDVGCGSGLVTRYFLDRGVDVRCVEGSNEAIANSRLPSACPSLSGRALRIDSPPLIPPHSHSAGPARGPGERIVQHDFTRGPWFPGNEVVDVAYTVEFMEHVDEEYLDNVMALFKSARYLVVSASQNEGWSHSNVHNRYAR
jgi:SAM-dependent methyltransferase